MSVVGGRAEVVIASYAREAQAKGNSGHPAGKCRDVSSAGRWYRRAQWW
jgi:hypothetical protein